MDITVLRLDHRKERDKRVSTHVALVARAFGARRIVYSGEKDESLERSVLDVASKWGGKFSCRHEKAPGRFARKFRGARVHLTFYGIPLPEFIGKNSSGMRKKGRVLVIVGGAKVPREFYEIADFNVSVTRQPHSEVAALAVFLHEIFGGAEEDLKFPGWRIRTIPSERGKLAENRRKKEVGGRRKD